MSVLVESLNRIEDWLSQLNPPLASDLQPGLSRKEIENRLSQVPYTFPDDLYILYQWHNGIRGDLFIWQAPLFGGFVFESIDSAMKDYSLKMEVEMDIRLDSWAPSWFPIFHCNKKDYYVILGKDHHDGEDSQILRVYWGGEYEECSTLSKLTLSIAECYENDVYYLNSDGFLEEDHSLASQIFEKNGCVY